MPSSKEPDTWRTRVTRVLFGSHDQDASKSAESSPQDNDEHPQGSTSKPVQIPSPQKDEHSSAIPIGISSSSLPSSSQLGTSQTQSSKLKNLQAMLGTSLEEKRTGFSIDKIHAPPPAAKDRITVRTPDHQRSSSVEEYPGMANRSSSPRIPPDRVTRSSFENTSRLNMGEHQRQTSSSFMSRSSEDQSVGDSQATSSKSRDRISSEDSIEEQDIVTIPQQLQKGDVMLKVTSRKVMQRIVRIDAVAGQILWGSKKNNCVNLESIREVRIGSDGRSYRTSLSISAAHEQRWISIIYQTNSIYKALHLIALSDLSLKNWKETLEAVQEERKLLISSVDMMQRRTSTWLRQQFRNADTSKDSRLDFNEIARLCRRLGIMSNREDLQRGFDEADKERLGYLDFAKFQRFVAVLKRRVEVEKLFDEWADMSNEGGTSSQCSESELQEAPNRSSKLMSQKAFASFLEFEQNYPKILEETLIDVYRKFSNNFNESKEGLNYDGFLAFLMSSDNAILSDQSSLALAAKADRTSSNSRNTISNEKRSQAETPEALIAISGQTRVTQDMTRPLPEYFISSSHNTYLTAGQLTGESTVEGYIRALLQGARSVELDIWDGPRTEPVVTHGHTLTTKVPLRDVIQAIGKYAFVASPYPLILSLEVHNDLEQQGQIAEILRTELGHKLLQYPLSSSESASLPSPQDLIGKILIKAKNLLLTKKPEDPNQLEFVMKDRSMSSTTDTTTTESESDNLIQNARDLVRSVKSKGRRLSQRRSKQDETEGSGTGEKKKVMSPALASLLIYTVGVKHRGINKKETYAIEHMISLSERTALKYAKSTSGSGGLNGEDLIKHNRTHLTRIYPSMNTFARLTYSANFFPNIFWSLGCQLVALNWQTIDLGYEMNQAMFMRNGKSGYVLKPNALRKKDIKNELDEYSTSSFINVTFTIISAQQLPRDRQGSSKQAVGGDGQSKEYDGTVLNPFVSIMAVVPDTASFSVTTLKNDNSLVKIKSDSSSVGDEQRKDGSSHDRPSTSSSSNSSTTPKGRKHTSRARTSTIWRNGFNPIWNETISFRIQIPMKASKSSNSEEDVQQYLRGLLDLCFIRFEVRNNESKRDQAKVDSVGDLSSPSNSILSSPLPDLNPTPSSSLKKTSNSDTKEAPSGRAFEQETCVEDSPCLATFMISLGSMEQGYHHVPLYDSSMSHLLYSTLFVKTKVKIEDGK